MKNLGHDCSRIFIKRIIFKLIHRWPQLFWIYSIVGCRFLQGKDSAMFLCGLFVVLTSGIWHLTHVYWMNESLKEGNHVTDGKNPPSITSTCWWGQRQSVGPEFFVWKVAFYFPQALRSGVDSKAVVSKYWSVAQWQPWWNFHLSSIKMTEIRTM